MASGRLQRAGEICQKPKLAVAKRYARYTFESTAIEPGGAPTGSPGVGAPSYRQPPGALLVNAGLSSATLPGSSAGTLFWRYEHRVTRSQTLAR